MEEAALDLTLGSESERPEGIAGGSMAVNRGLAAWEQSPGGRKPLPSKFLGIVLPYHIEPVTQYFTNISADSVSGVSALLLPAPSCPVGRWRICTERKRKMGITFIFILSELFGACRLFLPLDRTARADAVRANF